MIATKELSKRYYSISEVAQMFDVNTSLIRYYEAEFSFFKPHKRNGERRFTPKNIEDFGLLHNLVKERGFTLEGAALEFKRIKIRAKKKQEALKKLHNIRQAMRNMQATL